MELEFFFEKLGQSTQCGSLGLHIVLYIVAIYCCTKICAWETVQEILIKDTVALLC